MRACKYVCVFAAVFLQFSRESASHNCGLEYPEARRDESVIDNYHGTQIKDPYRWLEDSDSEETKLFIEAENNITRPYLDACSDKERFSNRIKEMLDIPKYLCPFRRGKRYFFYMKKGLVGHQVLYMQDSLDSEPRVLLDPNVLSEDGSVALAAGSVTDDGTVLAYALSVRGSDWTTVYFRDVETGQDYAEKLKKVKFSALTWTKDNKGFFYSAYLEQSGKADGSETNLNMNQKLYYHRLNTSQSEDVVVAEFPDNPLWMVSAEVTDDGQYLLITVMKQYRETQLFFVDLGQHQNITRLLPLTPIVEIDSEYLYVTTDGPVSVFLTNKDASNYRLITIDFQNPSEKNWKTLVPEHPNDVLDLAVAVGDDKLVLQYTRDVKSVLKIHDLRTGAFLQELPLDVGTVGQFSGKKGQSEIFFYFWSFLTPGIMYYVDLDSPAPYKPKVFREVVVKDFDASLFETKQVFYSSKDGTKIPMFIVSKKGLVLDGSHPLLLYGYGGFSVSEEPDFETLRVVFMQHLQGVFALANIRGGGEYGDRWYDAGRLLNKQNVFDDFQAAAEYLIAEKYTCPELLTIQGASNGGLTVAACINQRPELFGAAIVQIGVLDMLRFHKFTIGHAWVSDYGSSDNETHFYNLIKYSPLHNIRPPREGRAQYPATLVMTADHDDRVVPLHSLKFIAELQHATRGTAQTRPLLALIETDAGHGSGKPTSKNIEEETNVLSFIAQALKLTYVK